MVVAGLFFGTSESDAAGDRWGQLHASEPSSHSGAVGAASSVVYGVVDSVSAKTPQQIFAEKHARGKAVAPPPFTPHADADKIWKHPRYYYIP